MGGYIQFMRDFFLLLLCSLRIKQLNTFNLQFTLFGVVTFSTGLNCFHSLHVCERVCNVNCRAAGPGAALPHFHRNGKGLITTVLILFFCLRSRPVTPYVVRPSVSQLVVMLKIVTEWLSDRVTEWSSDWVTKWPSDQVQTEWLGDRKLRRRLTVWYILCRLFLKHLKPPGRRNGDCHPCHADVAAPERVWYHAIRYEQYGQRGIRRGRGIHLNEVWEYL